MTLCAHLRTEPVLAGMDMPDENFRVGWRCLDCNAMYYLPRPDRKPEEESRRV